MDKSNFRLTNCLLVPFVCLNSRRDGRVDEPLSDFSLKVDEEFDTDELDTHDMEEGDEVTDDDDAAP